MHRQAAISPELVERAEQVAQTSTRDSAVWRDLGIGKTTFYNWRKRGQAELDRIAAGTDDKPVDPLDSEAVYLNFRNAVTRGRERMEHRLEASLFQAALKDGDLALKVLERLNRPTWGKQAPNAEPVKVELSGPGGGPVEVSERARRGIEAAAKIVSMQEALANRVADG